MPTQSSDSTPQKLQTSMTGVRWFKQIMAHVQELRRLQEIVRQCLDWELAQHCYFLEIQKNQLILLAENAAWATQLNYNAPELVKKLQKYPEFSSVKKVRCSVRPTPAPSAIPSRKLSAPQPITEESAEFISQIAQGVSDERLKKALLKLARLA